MRIEPVCILILAMRTTQIFDDVESLQRHPPNHLQIPLRLLSTPVLRRSQPSCRGMPFESTFAWRSMRVHKSETWSTEMAKRHGPNEIRLTGPTKLLCTIPNKTWENYQDIAISLCWLMYISWFNAAYLRRLDQTPKSWSVPHLSLVN